MSESSEDDLTFNLERMLAGEASIEVGSTRSLAEAMLALRARPCS